MRVLLLSTVKEFFRQRAGFFLVALFLIFGFLTSREHHAFALFFLTDRWGMPILFSLWMGYGFLGVHFIHQQFTQSEFSFLFGARLWTPLKRVSYLGVMALGFVQPLLYYGLYMVTIALQEGILYKALPLLVFLPIVCLVIMGVTEWQLRHPDVAPATRMAVAGLPFKRPANTVFWIMEWLLRERGLTVILAKLGAVLFVVATLAYDRTGDYDLRLPAIGFAMAYLMNVGLSGELFLWESTVWLWGKSLPISLRKRFFTILFLHVLLLMPETLFAIREGGGQLNWWEWIQLYTLGISSLMLYHTRLYREGTQPEDLGSSLFGGFVVVSLLILYGIPLWVINSSLLLLAAWLYVKEKRR